MLQAHGLGRLQASRLFWLAKRHPLQARTPPHEVIQYRPSAAARGVPVWCQRYSFEGATCRARLASWIEAPISLSMSASGGN